MYIYIYIYYYFYLCSHFFMDIDKILLFKKKNLPYSQDPFQMPLASMTAVSKLFL